MAPVKVKYIVSFSSQDDCHKASNIVDGDGSKKWLSDPSNRSGKIEVILQLEDLCCLAYIDIGTIWCSSLEVRVGRSDWPQTAEFLSLTPVVSLMTPVDCRLGRGVNVTKMFSKADFSSDIAAQKWDRLQIICRQPFRKDVQLGISFIRLKSAMSMPRLGTEVEDASRKFGSENKSSRDVSSIQRHFFGKTLAKNSERASSEAGLRQRLLKISGSAEHGSDHEQSLSRTAKLVLKAAQNSNAQNVASLSTATTTPKRGLFSDLLAKQQAVPLEKDLKAFFSTLQISVADIERITVADLRHKFERKKRRKLTVEEKRKFSRCCERYICTLLDGDKEEVGSDASFVSAVSRQATPSGVSSGVDKPATPFGERENSKSTRKYQSSTLVAVSPINKDPMAPGKPDTSPNISKISRLPENGLRRTPFTSCGKADFTGFSDNTDVNFTSALGSPRASPGVRNLHPFVSKTTSTPKPAFIGTNSPKARCVLQRGSTESCKGLDIPTTKTNSDVNRILKKKSVTEDEEDAASLSSVSYDDDDEEGETNSNAELTTDSSPNILTSKKDQDKINQENVLKSYKKLYNMNTTYDTQAETNSQQSCHLSRKRKLNRVSVELLQDFSSELSAGDDTDENTDNNDDRLRENASTSQVQATDGFAGQIYRNGVTAPSLTTSAVHISPNRNLTFAGLAPKYVSPQKPKGKVYRMLTSPKFQIGKQIEQQQNTDNPKQNSSSWCADKAAKDSNKKYEQNVHQLNSQWLSKSSVVVRQSSASTREPTVAVVEPMQPLSSGNIGRSTTPSTPKRGRGKSGRGRGRGRGRSTDASGVPAHPRRGGRGGRGRPGARRGAGTGRRSSHNSTLIEAEQSEASLKFCEKCYGEFPEDVFVEHLPFCVRPAVFEISDDNSDNNSDDDDSGSNTRYEALIDETVDYAECPICLQRFAEDVLPVHASECGL